MFFGAIILKTNVVASKYSLTMVKCIAMHTQNIPAVAIGYFVAHDHFS